MESPAHPFGRQVVRAICLAVLFSPGAIATESATTTREVDLLREPDPGSDPVGRLGGGASVQLRQRSGPWYQVHSSAPALEGWLKMFSVRLSSDPRSATGYRNMLNTVSSGVGGTGVATGVRGLDPAMMQASSPNHQELQHFLQMNYSIGEAREFARVNEIRAKGVSGAR